MSENRWFMVSASAIELTLILVLYVNFMVQFGAAFIDQPNLVAALYIIDQTIVVTFMLVRRPAARITARPVDFITAALGTTLPMLAVPPQGNSLIPLDLCAGLLLLGLFLHLGSKLSLRRSLGVVAADRGVQQYGTYRFVRHPMYLGYIIQQLALFLAGPLSWNLLIFGLIVACKICRIMAEERVLQRNAEYRDFCRKTPFRLIPGLY